jgi:PAS domain S-box-containing protein
MPRFVSGLRTRLILLVLLAIIPAFGLILYTASEDRHRATMKVGEDARRLVQLAAADHEQPIAITRSLLVALAQLPQVRERDSAMCGALFVDLVKQYPVYTALRAAKPNGDVFCSSTPITAPLNYAGDAWFHRAVASHEFTVGDYAVGRVSRKAIIVLAYPALDDAGQLRAVVTADLDLAWLNALAAQAQLPPGSTLDVIDRNGMILAHYPDAEKWVGQQMPETSLAQAILTQREGVAEVSGADAVARLYAFMPLRVVPKDGVYVAVGIPMAVAFATADQMLWRNLVGLGVVAALTLIVTRFVSDLFILRRVNALLRATERLRAGDLSARTGLTYGISELSQLARAFDQTTTALQERESERKRAEESLRESEEKYRNVVERANDGILIIQDGIVRFANLRLAEMWRGTVEEIVNTPFAGYVHPDELLQVLDRYKRRIAGEDVPSIYETTLSRKDGSKLEAEVNAGIITYQGKPADLVIVRDITERKRAGQELRRRADEFSVLYQTAQDLAAQQDLPTLLQTIVERATALLAAPCGSIMLYNAARQDLELAASKDVQPTVIPRMRLGEGMAGRVAQNRQPLIVDDYQLWHLRSPQYEGLSFHAVVQVPLLYGGELIGVLDVSEFGESTRKFTDADARLLSLFAAQAASAVYNARLLAETQERAKQLTILNAAAIRIQQYLEPHEIFKAACNELQKFGTFASVFLVNAEGLGRHVYTSMSMETLRDYLATFRERQALFSFPLVSMARTAWDQLQAGQTFIEPDFMTRAIAALPPEARPIGEWMAARSHLGSVLLAPLTQSGRTSGLIALIGEHVDASDIPAVALFARHVSVALENARLFAQTRRHLAELEAVNRISTALRSAQTVDEMLPRLLDETLVVLNTDVGDIMLYDSGRGELQSVAARGWFVQLRDILIKPGEGVGGVVFATGTAYCSREFASDPRSHPAARVGVPAGWGGACIPIRTAQEIIGVFFVSVQLPRELTPDEVSILVTVAEMAGNAIHRMRLHEETTRHLDQVQALRTIDMAITASVDLRVTLDILLHQAAAQLRVDAADILLLNPRTQMLEYAAGYGFRTSAIQKTRLRLGEGYAGQTALERPIVTGAGAILRGGEGWRVAGSSWHTSLDPRHASLVTSEGFVAYYVVPLVAKGQVKGVLEIFHRAPLSGDPEWVSFLRAIAVQAAIAIDDAQLFSDLQRSNTELVLAYETTLETWSNAVDMRMHETEGHTARVTEMTLRLARTLGVSGEALGHTRRGALLHDIGKIYIPDAVLLKPEPFSDEEWQVVRKHPDYAHALLSSIGYLRPAVDIPYCHHERWDGTGYPRGLRKDQVPLAARIFAIVDVWDALRSPRPYRAAWTEEKARAYIREQQGKHFDPTVVEAFSRVVGLS